MAISFNQVSKRFGERKILDKLSFTAEKGEILFILGKSGVGKSVTLKCIVGLLRPDDGEIFVGGQAVHGATEDSLAGIRRHCGMVFQHPALLDSLTIFENVAFGLRRDDEGNSRDLSSRVKECIRLVHLSETILEKKPQDISYGMQKRVSLARTLAPNPSYLLFDEPTTGLDPITTTAVDELILELSHTLKTTSIVVSHDMQSALRVANRILVLEHGKIAAYGTVAEIKNSTVPLVQDFLSEVS